MTWALNAKEDDPQRNNFELFEHTIQRSFPLAWVNDTISLFSEVSVWHMIEYYTFNINSHYLFSGCHLVHQHQSFEDTCTNLSFKNILHVMQFGLICQPSLQEISQWGKLTPLKEFEKNVLLNYWREYWLPILRFKLTVWNQWQTSFFFLNYR